MNFRLILVCMFLIGLKLQANQQSEDKISDISETSSERKSVKIFKLLDSTPNCALQRWKNVFAFWSVCTCTSMILVDVHQTCTHTPLNSNNPILKYNFISRKIFTKIIKQKFKDRLIKISINCNKSLIRQLYSDNLLPTHITQPISSLLTTHGPTREYLYRIWNISPNPNCPTSIWTYYTKMSSVPIIKILT